MNGFVVGLFTGALGVGYFIYGKRQAKFVPLLCGIALCVYPYFVDGLPWQLGIGALLAALPFLVDA